MRQDFYNLKVLGIHSHSERFPRKGSTADKKQLNFYFSLFIFGCIPGITQPGGNSRPGGRP